MGDRPAGHADACAQEADGAVPVSPPAAHALSGATRFSPDPHFFPSAGSSTLQRRRCRHAHAFSNAETALLLCTVGSLAPPSFSRSSRAPSASRRRTRRTSFSVRRSNFAPPPVHASDSCFPSLHSRRVPKQERARARRRRRAYRRRGAPRNSQRARPPCGARVSRLIPLLREQFFTLSLGGMVTLLNTSAENIFAGGAPRCHSTPAR